MMKYMFEYIIVYSCEYNLIYGFRSWNSAGLYIIYTL